MAIAPIMPQGPRPSPKKATVVADSTAEPPPARLPSPWRWMVGACLILGAAGAMREVQERRFGYAIQNASVVPFPLRSLPMEVGGWINEGGEQELDNKTRQIAGAVDYISRSYVDKGTGVRLQALVVFGPAELVFPHAPTVCFPATGFQPQGAGRPHTIRTAEGPAIFESWVYANPAVPSSRTEVYFSYWHDGRWSPTAAQTSKRFRHHPEMFKVQVQRLVGPNERRVADEGGRTPIEDFLTYFLPEIEQRIAKAKSASSAEPSSTKSAPST